MRLFFLGIILSLATTLTSQSIADVDSINEFAVPGLLSADRNTIPILLDARQMAIEIGYEKGRMDAANRLGILYYNLQSLDTARNFYNEVLKIAERNSDSVGIIKAMGNLGLVDREEGKLHDALKRILYVIPIYRKIDPQMVSGKLLDAASVYYDLAQTDKAIEHAEEALLISRENGQRSIEANALNSLGVFYQEVDSSEIAEEYLLSSAAIKEEIGDQLGLMNTLINLGEGYHAKEELNKASNTYINVIRLAREFNAPRQLADALHNRAAVLTAQGKYTEATPMFLESYNLHSEAGMLKHSLAAAGSLAENYLRTGKPEAAGRYFRIQKELSDSLYQLELAGSIAEMETRYRTEQKERENEELRYENNLRILEAQSAQRNTRWIIMASTGILFVMVLMGFSYLKYNRLKSERAEERALLEGEQREQIRLARELHDSLGQKLAVIKMQLQNGIGGSIDPLVDDAIGEVRSISHRLISEDLNFGIIPAVEQLCEKFKAAGKIDVQFQSDGSLAKIDLSKTEQLNLYRIIQEVMGNMLKHSGADIIELSIKKHQGRPRLTISDNGKGLKPKQIYGSGGMGWSNILARAKLISARVLVDSQRGKGTTISLEFDRG